MKGLSDEELDAAMETGQVTLECGCVVELDGSCHHGNESPLIEAGLI